MVFSDQIAKRFDHRWINPDDNVWDFGEEIKYAKKICYKNGNIF